LRGSQQRPQDVGKKMGVLMGVQMRDRDASVLQLANLRCHFCFELFRNKPATAGKQSELAQTLTKVTSVSQIDEARNFRGGNHRSAIHENYVTANTESRRRLGRAQGIVKRGSVGHKRGGSHDASRVGL